MSLFFIIFLAILAAFLLLTLSAALKAIWQRPGRSRSVPKNDLASGSHWVSEALLTVGIALAWWNVSTGWVLYRAVYPIYVDMSAVSPEAFHAFGIGYLSRLAIVILPYGLMCLVWSLLLWVKHPNVSRAKVWSIVVILLISVVVTPLAGTAQDTMSETGFAADLYDRLKWAHLVRTIMVTAAGILALVVMSDVRTESNNTTSYAEARL
jgi:hypothetical protein